jgi:hypothetical protein
MGDGQNCVERHANSLILIEIASVALLLQGCTSMNESRLTGLYCLDWNGIETTFNHAFGRFLVSHLYATNRHGSWSRLREKCHLIRTMFLTPVDSLKACNASSASSYSNTYAIGRYTRYSSAKADNSTIMSQLPLPSLP